MRHVQAPEAGTSRAVVERQSVASEVSLAQRSCPVFFTVRDVFVTENHPLAPVTLNADHGPRM